MRRGAKLGVSAALFGGWLVAGCLGVSGVDDGSEATGGSGGGTGGGVGDGSWPDSPGGSGGADASTGGTTNTGGDGGIPSGGAGGSGASGGGGGTTGGAGGVGSTGGAGGTGGTPSAHVYTYNLSTGSWSAPIALSAIWTGANAPPSSGILAVTQLEHFDRLLVFADDGKFYLRLDGAWQPPVATTTAFPVLAGLSIGALYHVASPPGTTPLSETITFTANPTAVLYKYNANDSIVWLDTVTMTDEPSPGAPQGTGKALFNFEIRDPSKLGSPEYYLFYGGYSNGNLYQLDAAIVWKSWPIAQSPFWNGKANAPPTTGLEAAWTDEALDRVFIIGP